MSKKILVTGSEGFIGSHLVECLVTQGYDIKAFVLYNSFNNHGWLEELPDKVKGNFEIFMGDIRNIDSIKLSMQSCDTVLNLAALIGIPYSYISPSSYIDTNLNGTNNLLEVAKDQGVKKFIHTSTSEVYGSAQYIPIDEKHPLVGQSPYSASKIGADQLALSYHFSFGLPVSVLRPFNTFGPRQSARAIIPTIISQIASKKKTIRLGSLKPTRDYTYVEDVAYGFIKSMNSKKNIGEITNLGTGFEISMGDLANEISDIMNAKIQIIEDKKRVRPKKSEVQRLVSNNSKAKKILKWKPKYSGVKGFRIALKKTINWYLYGNNLNKIKSEVYNV
jgi:NAD dependent epimerase/dehydratase